MQFTGFGPKSRAPIGFLRSEKGGERGFERPKKAGRDAIHGVLVPNYVPRSDSLSLKKKGGNALLGSPRPVPGCEK